MNKNVLVFDASNILHRTFFVHAATEPELIVNLTYHTTFITLNKYFNKIKPDQIVMAFDRGNWRKAYTESVDCYSKKLYKGHRQDAMSPKMKELYGRFLAFVNEFENLLRQYSGIICLAKDQLEADDILGGLAERAHRNQTQVTIVSADKDMLQLLKYNNECIDLNKPHVTIIDPATGKNRELEDPDYFLFEKCVRGDPGDNVQSAFPRVRKQKIMEAYKDSYARLNMFKEQWTNQEGRVLEVGTLFNENKLLMDLSAQPTHIRELIFTTIDEGFSNVGRYNHFQFQKFLGKHQLKNLSSQLTTFIPILTCGQPQLTRFVSA